MKISDVVKKNPTETDVKGLFIRNISYKELEDYQSAVQKMGDEDPVAVVHKAFEVMLCDKDGAPFEDVTTQDDVRNNLG